MDSRKITEEELEQAAKLYQDHYERMEQYISLLLDWNEKINLVSRMVSRETVRYHVIHSLVPAAMGLRSEEHTSELQSRGHLVCRLLLEKKKDNDYCAVNVNILN